MQTISADRYGSFRREASLAQLKAAASRSMTENEAMKRSKRKTPYPVIGYRTLGDGTKIVIYAV